VVSFCEGKAPGVKEVEKVEKKGTKRKTKRKFLRKEKIK